MLGLIIVVLVGDIGAAISHDYSFGGGGGVEKSSLDLHRYLSQLLQ